MFMTEKNLRSIAFPDLRCVQLFFLLRGTRKLLKKTGTEDETFTVSYNGGKEIGEGLRFLKFIICDKKGIEMQL